MFWPSTEISLQCNEGQQMPPDSRQVDVQQKHGERNPTPARGRQELATAAGAGDVKLTEPKLLPDEQELRRIIDLIPQTIVVLNPTARPFTQIAWHLTTRGSLWTKCAPITSGIACSIQKEHVREALGGHKLEVAFDAIGGTAIDDLAEVVDDGGTIINFGSLGSNMGTNIYSLTPNNVALKSVSIMSWFRLTQDEKQKDFELALSLATNHPELFEVAHEYEFGDFQKAIQHVSSPGKTGIVLLKSPV
jgi:hypothetical protein